MMQASARTPTPPLHGFRGDRPQDGPFTRPKGLTLAISREAGARGTSIARKVGEQLGWQVFDQESLDYLLLDETGRAHFLARGILRDPTDLSAYDAMVNWTRLGVEGAAQFIGWAVRTKQMMAELFDPSGRPESDEFAGS